SNADIAGFRVGGKTGSAEKSSAGGYRRKALISSFIGVFPMDNPRYAVFVVLDEPNGTAETFNYATGGWTAAPAVGQVIARIAPILGIAPRFETETSDSAARLLRIGG
ncbi:MAG: penicillin-binding protein 2, partial [Alphaproteobacteria bacterium]